MSKIKVILNTDVAGQGRKGDIVSVSEGYAKNFLLKGNKGIIATDEEMKKLEAKKNKAAAKDQAETAVAEEQAKVLGEKTLFMKVKAGENGKVFGSITNKEISEAIKAQFDMVIDKKKIDGSIKKIGEHKVNLKLHKGVKASLKVIAERM
ncbi:MULTISPECIES: 50S ribosomal protein L9 [Psychrilyobacter]|uniref:Large ribosomal subunit protein bL9 n=1 Tax=Psychrilyobacter piezotolerans TaxID=2293438 RepID=A0ABX9KK20_9FUSO|nr:MULTISPECIES: 50S ribosomal protein L9 [Psychrilyobacter]MCS5421434.1 50S ribosomal protein L9 [Psychrilyobacter sp. S5]NDI76584.1 50S ribosomal protein L9 [Psychrilyobacter piezotolerans]RDE65216.1 50S ribosomal protein L9 [Psychrilyobacter sp. S5]REI42834.1 50S ribosomal protein L9 [Psychrilyobacter piezotolerans]